MIASSSSETEPAATRGNRGMWLTAFLWAVGIGLQFAAPLLRDRVPLSDELFIMSFLAPWWMFLLAVILAGVLLAVRRVSERWSEAGRVAFGIGAAAVLMMLQPEVITQVIANESALSGNPLRVALMWSTPLAFYVVPAGLVVFSWLRRDGGGMSMPRALALGLVVIGVLNFVYILWLTHLWDTYVRTSGGESVRLEGALRRLFA